MHLWIDKSAWVSSKACAKANRLTIDKIERIAVIKHAALGDLLLTRPLFITLREYFPKSKITLNVIDNYLDGIPYDLIDDIYIIKKDESSFYHNYITYRKFGHYDLLFDITATTRSFWISYIANAKLKIGYKHKGVERLVYDAAVPRSDYKFEAETFLDQLLILGLSYKWPLEFNFDYEPLQREKPYILYFPTASTMQKCWSLQKYYHLIDTLCRDLSQFDHIILRGVSRWEKEICNNIKDKIGNINNILILDGGNETPKIVKGAKLVVSNDTGIRNMAIAAYTPSVGIFVNTLPFRYFPRFGNHQVIFRIDGSEPSVIQVKEAVYRSLSLK